MYQNNSLSINLLNNSTNNSILSKSTNNSLLFYQFRGPIIICPEAIDLLKQSY